LRVARAVAVGLFLAAVVMPLLSALGLPLASFALRQFFVLVCHQDPARSFWILGAPMAVCARCFGIYTGAAVASFAARVRRARGMLLIAIVVNAADVVGEVAGMHGDWQWVRFALGIALGAAAMGVIQDSFALRGLPRLKNENPGLTPWASLFRRFAAAV